ncbi:hypothetical protein EVAR_71473_1 [Eumeta japonica]|uniref:Uncharacterized protein n=1 Tax=Eumeta variegata TaxID=151549 RepID=A0A4C1TA75_EUMVA|nr:hypothetical protein EVAR_71473_1 [Eumeta japonica]
MRQTGIALGTILANAVGILAPYLVYLGTTVDIRSPYYILVCPAPPTNANLATATRQAADDAAMEKLNQAQYAP